MICHTYLYAQGSWPLLNMVPEADKYQLVLVFGDRFLLQKEDITSPLAEYFINAKIVAASSAGEILQNEQFTDGAVAIAIHFEKTNIHICQRNLSSFTSSSGLGITLANELPKENLKYAMLLADGNKINGTELVSAITGKLGNNVLITGGMAGDNDRFTQTFLGVDGTLEEGNVVLIGFYGDSIEINSSIRGGWEAFGPERIITFSDKNILYEIDQTPSLAFYKKYLGKYAAELPASALLFPLALYEKDNGEPIVRTILSINEEEQSMTFAGNVPQGSMVRLMKANVNNLVKAADTAAKEVLESSNEAAPDLALVIGCIGRKMIMGHFGEEETEAIASNFNEQTKIIGFLSYGEIAPTHPNTVCRLHNQSIIITTFRELI